MDPRVLAIQGELETYLPGATPHTLATAAYEWVSWLGRELSVADADSGLRADFMRRFGGGSCTSGGSRVWAR